MALAMDRGVTSALIAGPETLALSCRLSSFSSMLTGIVAQKSEKGGNTRFTGGNKQSKTVPKNRVALVAQPSDKFQFSCHLKKIFNL